MNFSDNGRNRSDHSRVETIVIINSVLNAVQNGRLKSGDISIEGKMQFGENSPKVK